MIHDQLPLAVPCYDLVPVTEFTLDRDKHGRRVLPAPLTWRAVSTRLENIFTAALLIRDY